MSTAENENVKPSLTEIENLSEQVGEFVYYWGFKRIQGKIWAHLFLANRPLDAADLISRLQISKALISITMRELLDLEMVMDAGKSAKGTQLYSANPDIMRVLTHVLQNRERRTFARMQVAQENLNRLNPDAMQKNELDPNKIKQLGEMIQTASKLVEQILKINPLTTDVLLDKLR